MSAKLLKGRYTQTHGYDDTLVGRTRYLDPQNGTVYSDEGGKRWANSGFREADDGRWVNGLWVFVIDTILPSPASRRIAGRYTRVPLGWAVLGATRFLDTDTGETFYTATCPLRRCDGFRPTNQAGVWASADGFEFTADEVATEPAKPIFGYVVASSNGAPTALHHTQEIAEAEALRLAQGNTGIEFTVYPVYCGKAVAKACTPKPEAKLERL